MASLTTTLKTSLSSPITTVHLAHFIAFRAFVHVHSPTLGGGLRLPVGEAGGAVDSLAGLAQPRPPSRPPLAAWPAGAGLSHPEPIHE